MKLNNNFKKKINKCVVRIIAEDININWNIPYLLEEPYSVQGTGFFINSNGIILTCAHVVDCSKNLYIEIPFLGSDKYRCEVISIVPKFDIAIIRCLEYKNKDFLELGNSDNLDVNSEVHVVGYPTALKKFSTNSNNLKFTSGIISGQQSGLIQTDSAINPGNSGGPLFLNNKVIGINSSKLVGEQLENIGHAVPINNYKVIKDNIDSTIIYRPNLLFTYNNTDKDIIKKLTNGKIDYGVMVSKIFDYSPFKNTNIKKDTIITEINGFKINNFGLTSDYKWIGTNININILLNKFKNNENIKIKYYNNEKLGFLKIKLEPFISPIKKMYSSFENIDYLVFSGMIFMNFCKNHLNYISNNDINVMCNIDNTEEKLKEKLYVSYIYPNSKVSILKNINKHNFIVKVNEINVKNVHELINALKKPIIINKIEYIKFEEKNGKSIILSLEDIIKEDLKFSNDYKFELNEIHKKYMKKLNIH